MSEKQLIRIATRKSPLALWQANHVKHLLEKKFSDVSVELVKITTQGDKILDTPLAKIGGKGLFVKELENALLSGAADLAVHSMKDVPMSLPEGLCMPVICKREDPRDAFVSQSLNTLDELPEKACVGTASLRRQSQLKALRPDLTIKTLRGNVGTRLQKLLDGEYDAIVLATAGLLRLDLDEHIRQVIDINTILPAAGQGAVGIECRNNDESLIQKIRTLNHPETQCCVTAERAMNRKLEGGCQVPIGGYAVIENDQLYLRGLVGSLCGQNIVRASQRADLDQAETLGIEVAEQLLSLGADKILQSVQDAH